MKPDGRGFRVSLRWRILLSSSAVLSVLIFSMLIYVNYQARRYVAQRIESDLLQGRRQIESTMEDQFSGLTLTARVLASVPRLKALLQMKSPAVKDLLSYREQHRGLDLLIALDATGRVLARTDSENAENLEDGSSRWIAPLLLGRTSSGMLWTKEHLYSVVVVPASSDETVLGFLLAGSQIEDAFANRLREVSHDEVVVLENKVVGSTIPAKDLPWQSSLQWAAQTGGGRSQYNVQIAKETYTAYSANLPYQGAPTIVVLQSHDRALAPYQKIQNGLLLLGLLATTAGVFGSALLGRHLAAPVADIVLGTRQVAGGNFNFRLKIRRNDEIGDLANAFNLMIEDLRQRADMQKFMSRSALEMIRGSAQHEIQDGKRTMLTIFFSDIRGFTALSERRDPEFVVRVLNHIFSVQTEQIKRFSGDVDKFVGDAVVAVFQGEDAANNAVLCAIEISKALAAYNATPEREEPIHLGFGIATGEVILGSIGSEDRRDYTVIGSRVNLSARLCSLAHPGEILLDQSTYLHVQQRISAEPIPPQSIKGFSEAVLLYRVVPDGHSELPSYSVIGQRVAGNSESGE